MERSRKSSLPCKRWKQTGRFSAFSVRSQIEFYACGSAGIVTGRKCLFVRLMVSGDQELCWRSCSLQQRMQLHCTKKTKKRLYGNADKKLLMRFQHVGRHRVELTKQAEASWMQQVLFLFIASRSTETGVSQLVCQSATYSTQAVMQQFEGRISYVMWLFRDMLHSTKSTNVLYIYYFFIIDKMPLRPCGMTSKAVV